MKKIAVILLILIMATFTACAGQPDPAPDPIVIRNENLAKLARVWGFVKYTHASFITGQLDWDKELLSLIPIIYGSNGDDVNGILYDWFISLGNSGFDSGADPNDHADLRPMADLSWINYDYLGPLAASLQQFNGIIAIDVSDGPITLSGGTPDFSNQSHHDDMDFDNIGYRLLGLFRLWNAMNYYFPHLDVLDANWGDLLLEFIPKMLDGEDRLSYELTLAAMARHLHDAHVSFIGATFFADKFGAYAAPVQ